MAYDSSYKEAEGKMTFIESHDFRSDRLKNLRNLGIGRSEDVKESISGGL
jgi:hypothetical protein